MSSKFYVYQYLREKDSLSGNAGTPYYIGKGSRNRAWDKRRKFSPGNPENIVIIQEGMEEKEAFALETALIAKYGRVDQSTGILRNRTAGGEGGSGMVVSEATRKLQQNNMTDRWKILKVDESHMDDHKDRFVSSTAEYWANSSKEKRSARSVASAASKAKNIDKMSLEDREAYYKQVSDSISGENNGMYGNTHTDAAKDVIGAATLNRRADYTCTWCDFIGTKSKQTRWHDDNCKSNPGYKLTPIIHKERTCPYCFVSGGGSGMTRYHFFNCKLKP